MARWYQTMLKLLVFTSIACATMALPASKEEKVEEPKVRHERDQPMDYHRDPHSDDQYEQDKHYYTTSESHYRHDGLLRERRDTKIEAALRDQQIEKIATEAYIYSYPIAINYKTMYGRPFNVYLHQRHLITPDFTDVVTPNEDTLYSSAWLDLRTEPIVLSVPEVPAPRYYSMQLVDIYTHNFAIFGTLTTGRSAGNYLITGPYWDRQRRTPKGIDAVYQSEGDFVFVLARTESLLKNNQTDLDEVHDIQNSYTLTTLSQFTGKRIRGPKRVPEFPVFDESKMLTIDAFTYSNFLLQFVHVHPSEKELFQRFKTIGVGPGLTVDSSHSAAITVGVNKAMAIINRVGFGQPQKNNWAYAVNPPPFGTREVLEQQPHWYLWRAVSAFNGLYGLDPSESYYPSTYLDMDGMFLDGGQSNYTWHFESDQLPQVQAFWSLSMYDTTTWGFIHNPINRCSIGLRTDNLSYGDDGSLTIYIQKDSPGGDKESNWLPAPNGQFYVVMRIYGPSEEALEGPYVPPGLYKIDTEDMSGDAYNWW